VGLQAVEERMPPGKEALRVAHTQTLVGEDEDGVVALFGQFGRTTPSMGAPVVGRARTVRDHVHAVDGVGETFAGF